MSKQNGKPVTKTASAPTTPPSAEVGEIVSRADAVELPPPTEVVEQATRRQYSPRYKLRVLRETDELEAGQVGAYLRREGLYSSILSTWRRQREAGALASLTPQQRGPKSAPGVNADSKRVGQLEKENAKLNEQLRRLALVLDVQKKILLLCGETVPETNA
jgi:transposase-like protein